MSIITLIKRKGIIEFLYQALKIIFDRSFSFLKIVILQIRGYKVDYSVLLRGNNTFFQSIYGSIKIESKSTIGKGARITTGGNGKILIEENVLIDDYSFVMAHEKIVIGKNTAIAGFCFITDFNHKYGKNDISVLYQGYETKPVTIGKNVWIGTHSIILSGVSIGDGAVIGAGSIVTKDIPANSIAVGAPAKVVKKIKNEKGR